MVLTNKYFFVDGKSISEELIQKFDLRNNSRNLRFSHTENGDVLNFVGFVILGEEVLISLPKHYAASSQLNEMRYNDINLLFEVLLADQVRNVQNYIGEVKEFESSFPFRAFFGIYRYYQQFGLYHETNIVTRASYSGKISWKDTIRKAANVISENNLVYLPLFIKETQNKQVFISRCMAFAINYTLQTYPMFVKGKAINVGFNNFDFWRNKGYVVGRLKKAYNEVFKDLHKQLVRDLIDFFSSIPEGGNITIKHYNFELVWEAMVEEYLNDYFIGVDDNGLKFSQQRLPSSNKFTKMRFNADKVHPLNRLEPDHYLHNREEQFIFDAKYFSRVYDLNHKQVAYYTFLRNQAHQTYNALILPTYLDSYSKVHFDLDEKYFAHPDDRLVIWEYYLHMKRAMINFIE